MGDIHEGFGEYKYGPTLAHTCALQTVLLLTRKTVGSSSARAEKMILRGAGTFTQYDLHGKILFEERFTATATKASV